ncbi:MAG: hypothetical protein R3E72_12660 [Steroidobacteraceae bacterium]
MVTAILLAWRARHRMNVAAFGTKFWMIAPADTRADHVLCQAHAALRVARGIVADTY